jgi:hypothetical protein
MLGWDGGGNVPPMLALGKRLAARRREVRLLAPPTLEDRAAAAGIEFVSFEGEPGWVPRSDRAIEDEPVAFGLHLAGPEMADELISAVERLGPSLLVIDAMAGGALCAAERLGLPALVLVHCRYRYFASERGAAAWEPARALLNQTRARLGLEPLAATSDLLAGLWSRRDGCSWRACPSLRGRGPRSPSTSGTRGRSWTPRPARSLRSWQRSSMAAEGRW